MCPNILCAHKSLVVGNRLHPLSTETLQGRRVLAEVKFGSDQDDRDIGRMVIDLGVPLESWVLVGQ
jgi:hypothetical protein